jgi:hypothetical protein
MTRALMFKFGPELQQEFPPLPEEPGPPLASILDPILRARAYRAKWIAEPPDGYGSIVGPKKAIVNREFTIDAVFAARPFDSQDASQVAWMGSLTEDERRRFPIELRVQSTQAFDLSDKTRTLELGQRSRVAGASFLVRPAIAGRQHLHLFMKYPGDRPETTFDWPIRIRTRFTDVMEKIGTVFAILGPLATIVGVLKGVGVF